MIIPFVPFPLRQAMKEAKVFERAGNIIWKSHPSLKLDLYQAEINIHPKIYSSIVALTTFFYFCVITPVIFLVSLIAGRPEIVLPLAIGSIFSTFVFFYLLRFPKLVAVRRMKKLETDLQRITTFYNNQGYLRVFLPNWALWETASTTA